MATKRTNNQTQQQGLYKPKFGFRFLGSCETFVYSDKRLRPTWEPPKGYRLKAEHRRQLCVHLAAHAAVSEMGRAWVYMLAVPPAGVRSWTISERKCNSLGKIWGVCSTSDVYCDDMEWDDDGQRFVANRQAWEAKLSQRHENFMHEHLNPRPDRSVYDPFSGGAPTLDEFLADNRRVCRAQVCGYLAGHIADGIVAGMTADEALSLYDRRDTQYVGESDIVVAQGLAGLLPPGEYENAVRVTEEVLRRPYVWEAVTQLAEELEKFGLIEGDDCECERRLKSAARGGRKVQRWGWVESTPG